ncbi:MAG: hypothetical protein ACYC3X_26065 [Pirellulaceae bacterium]
MTEQEQHYQREVYFTSRRLKIAQYWFKTAKRTELRDHEDDADQRCRFCARGKPKVTFNKLAHAVADFLGNLSSISLNECDECNTFFGEGCEDAFRSRARPCPRGGFPLRQLRKSLSPQRRIVN